MYEYQFDTNEHKKKAAILKSGIAAFGFYTRFQMAFCKRQTVHDANADIVCDTLCPNQ